MNTGTESELHRELGSASHSSKKNLSFRDTSRCCFLPEGFFPAQKKGENLIGNRAEGLGATAAHPWGSGGDTEPPS